MDLEQGCTRAVLVTANVGSIFEEPETMFPTWLQAFFQCIQTHRPGLVALHCQEVGGKNYEASMQHVNQFIKTLLACQELHKYDRARIFLDEDYTASDKFTALGNLYFVHEEVTDVLIWDFVDCKFIEVEGREVLTGSIENIPIKEKAKFPQHFFPEFKWSRKGFLRTRWSINSCIFDLVNIHLFHDASNIVAMESSPSVYLESRQRVLLHTLQRFENDMYNKVPLFIFGDFNFRLDSNLLIQELTGKLVASQTTGKKGQVNKIDYAELDTGKTVLTIGSKSFDYYDKHSDLFTNMNKWLHQYDTEFSSFEDRLYEYDITFPPSYPFCEDVSDGVSYMKTRVPSWCDRVLLTHSTKDIISQDPSHQITYDLIGKDVCMGDHKPAYLFIHITPGKGNCEQQQSPESPKIKHLLSSHEPNHNLSINGELIKGVDLSLINIHDYAIFENEQNLIPEFKKSIKIRNRSSDSFTRLLSSQAKVVRNRSFQEIAREVITLEKVLLQWPKRPHSRHHSSSSEDFPSDDCGAFNNEPDSPHKQIVTVETEISQCSSDNVIISAKDLDSPKGSFIHDSPHKQTLTVEVESGQCSSDNVTISEKDLDSPKHSLIHEADDSRETAQENNQITLPNKSPLININDTLENRGSEGDKFRDYSFNEQMVDFGDDYTDTSVVSLAQHDGHVHEVAPASPVSTVPQLVSQSYQKEPQNGKTVMAVSSPSSRGCCCVVM